MDNEKPNEVQYSNHAVSKKKGFIIYKNVLASTKGITKEGTANKTVMLVIKITFLPYIFTL